MAAGPGLRDFFLLILKHATFTAGGGSVTTVALERDLVERNHWLTQHRFRALYGLARITPGTSILALVTGLGWELHRWPGAVLGLLLAAVPGGILAVLLAYLYLSVAHLQTAQVMLAGTAAAVCGLIGASIWRMMKPYLTPTLRASTVTLFALVLAVALLGISPFPVFIGLAVLGYFLPSEPKE